MGRSGDLPRRRGEFDGDDSGCPMLHVDMDAFFASVEIRRRPELRGKPVIVGGGHRGVVSAASYEARRYGVRSAMPMTQATRRCPRAIVLPVDRAAYVEASAHVMAILRDVTPLVEPLSLDEAFLDVSGAVRLLGRPGEIAARIRQRVAGELALTCSVGVGPTKFVAKLASARCKPDGMLVVPAPRVIDFLHPLPVTALWGVGARTAEVLHRLGIRTVGDLAATPGETLRRVVGTASAEHLAELAHGRDPRPVQPDEIEKSISSDRTFATDLSEEAEVVSQLLQLSGEVGRRLRERGWLARTIGIKIRFADFTNVTRVRTLDAGTDSTAAIHAAARALYRSLELDQPLVRLVGVKAENLLPAKSTPEQLALDLGSAAASGPRAGEVGRLGARPAVERRDEDAPAAEPARASSVTRRGDPAVDRAVDRAVDAARERFGRDIVRPASAVRISPQNRRVAAS
jgi:DNA polymerase-4